VSYPLVRVPKPSGRKPRRLHYCGAKLKLDSVGQDDAISTAFLGVNGSPHPDWRDDAVAAFLAAAAQKETAK